MGRIEPVIRKILLGIGVLVAALLAILCYRAWNTVSLQPAVTPAQTPAAQTLAIDAAQAANHLAEAIRLRTVSMDDGEVAGEAFAAFHELLARNYPKVHQSLRLEPVATHSLLYTWAGKNPNRSAILIAHQDVVPAADDDSGWKFPPFEGRIADGAVWGRGALDDKLNLIGMMEAAEILLRQGFTPEGTIYFGFGHDEESAGTGAEAIAKTLESRGVHPDLLVDEGGAIVTGMLPGLAKPAAAVGIAEKGYLDLELSAEGAGGHSMAPPPHTAIGTLSDTIVALEKNPLPARLTPILKGTFDYAAADMPFATRLLVRNLWLFGGIASGYMASNPVLAGQVRTTIAVNLIEGGTKANVLPSKATAVVNFRILPGDTVDSVIAHVRTIVGNRPVKLRKVSGSDPPPTADPSSAGGRLVAATVRQVFPEAVFVPVLSSGATDARHYGRLTPNLFRFSPNPLTDETIKTMHGRNERIAVSDLERLVKFYLQLLQNLGR